MRNEEETRFLTEQTSCTLSRMYLTDRDIHTYYIYIYVCICICLCSVTVTVGVFMWNGSHTYVSIYLAIM